MLIDTHCHLYHQRLQSDRMEVLERARAAGVGTIVMPAIDVSSIHQAIDLCRRQKGLYAMAALHPSETRDAGMKDFEEVRSLCDDEYVVAVGESGLDYYWDRTFEEKQHDFLRLHIRLAVEKDVPLVLHNREASEDLIRILKEEKEASPFAQRLRGIFHCFGGTSSFASEVIALGFHLGIGGTLTFKNSGVAEAIQEVPMERIVLETDAPFLAPVPYRGKRNEPAYIAYVAEALAEARGVTVKEIEDITTGNALRLFDRISA